MNSDIVQYNILPYINDSTYSNLLLVNKDFYNYCLNGITNFIHELDPNKLWDKNMCNKYKNIKLSLNLHNNNKITDEEIKHLKNIYSLNLWNNNKITDEGIRNLTNLHI